MAFTLTTPTSTSTYFATNSFSTLAFFAHNRHKCSRRLLNLPPLRVTAPSTPTPAAEEQKQEQPTTVDDVIIPEIEVKDESSKFTWRDHWYPVSLLEDLDRRKPTPFQLLNRDIVLWLDKSNDEWVAFDDKCPHRLAPLSEGRIDENGDLQCSYHGWSFNGCGVCSHIPQAKLDSPGARAVKSPRACATKLPTMVSQGLLFVWPDENGWERARLTDPPRLPDDFDNPEFATVKIQRDLYYGFDTVMDNFVDPSHVDFAHHKVTGNRNNAKPLTFKVKNSGPWGFAGVNEDNPRISAKFVAPCYYVVKLEIDTKLPIFGDQKWLIWSCSFNVPMAPGKTRSIICATRNFFQLQLKVIPRWYTHWTSNKVYDGDISVLQAQEKILLSKSTETSEDVNEIYSKIAFLPTQSDRFVMTYRNWLRRHGNSEPEWFGPVSLKPLPSMVLTRRQMLDRFEQHTIKCSSCKGAYEGFQNWKKILIAATIIFAATAGIPGVFQKRVILSGLAIVSASIAYALNELEKNFVFTDYIHAEID